MGQEYNENVCVCVCVCVYIGIVINPKTLNMIMIK
jgi:hypothetical protein